MLLRAEFSLWVNGGVLYYARLGKVAGEVGAEVPNSLGHGPLGKTVVGR